MVNEQGDEAIIRFIDPGEMTAAIAILRDRDYPATAESIDRVEIIGWDKKSLMFLMEKCPQIAINVLNVVMERLEDMQPPRPCRLFGKRLIGGCGFDSA